jgi:predicted RNA-binding protein with PIN domain
VGERILIVDAHNVIFAWPELRTLLAHRKSLAREKLVRILTEFQDVSGTRVVAVFDGRGESVSEASEPGGIQIFYSPAGKTADDVIERLTAKYANKRDITVATSDTLEQDTATACGASVVSAEGLKAIIEDASAIFAREMKLRRRKPDAG